MTSAPILAAGMLSAPLPAATSSTRIPERKPIRRTTYPSLQHTGIATAFVDTTIVVSADLPDAAGFEIIRLLLGNPHRLAEIHPSPDRFDPFIACRNVPAPIHAGAARAYREMGFMD